MAKYVDLLFRFRIRFFLLLVLLPAVIGGATVFFFPTYKATASLWVDSPTAFGTAFTPIGWNRYLTPSMNESDILTQLLGTRAFATGLDDRLVASGEIPNKTERDQVVWTVGAHLKVTATGSQLMTISMTCDRPAVCTQVLIEAINLFREQEGKLQAAQFKAGKDFLSTQLQNSQATLKVAEDSLQRYLAEHPGVKADAVTASTNSDLARLMGDVQQNQANANDLQYNLNAVTTMSSASAATGPKVIDAPHVSRGGLLGDGTSLKRAGMYAGACVAVGLIYLFALSWVDKTTRDVKELERRLKVPVVATIPVLSPVKAPALSPGLRS
jgi:hypothetical protein